MMLNGHSGPIATDAGVPIHLDGARIWNAAAAADVPVTEWTTQVDTVMFCLSKGLGAPVGSLVCGSAEQIREAGFRLVSRDDRFIDRAGDDPWWLLVVEKP